MQMGEVGWLGSVEVWNHESEAGLSREDSGFGSQEVSSFGFQVSSGASGAHVTQQSGGLNCKLRRRRPETRNPRLETGDLRLET